MDMELKIDFVCVAKEQTINTAACVRENGKQQLFVRTYLLPRWSVRYGDTCKCHLL